MDTTDRVELPRTGDLLSPFLRGVTLDGELSYERLWQHRNVVLFVLPARTFEAVKPYLNEVNDRLTMLKPPDTSLVIAQQSGSGVPMNTMLVADRWGEIARAMPLADDPTRWPLPGDILEWVEFVRAKCPECPQ
jgi:hypothetical protein